MAYVVTQDVKKQIADALIADYEEKWHGGVLDVMDRMRVAKMAHGPKEFNQAKDFAAKMRRESSNEFLTSFKLEAKQFLKAQSSNKWDLADKLLPIATMAVQKGMAGAIPLPGGSLITDLLGTAISKGVAKGVDGGASSIHDIFQGKKTGIADQAVVNTSGQSFPSELMNDVSAGEYAKNAIQEYVDIAKTISTLKLNQTTQDFTELATFPSKMWTITKETSSLNVKIWALECYIASMRARLSAIQQISKTGLDELRTKMEPSIGAVLQKAHGESYSKGRADAGKGPPNLDPSPTLTLNPTKKGGVTTLAAHVVYAAALGYWEATTPKVSEPRAVTPPPGAGWANGARPSGFAAPSFGMGARPAPAAGTAPGMHTPPNKPLPFKPLPPLPKR